MKTNYPPNLWMKYDVNTARPHRKINLHPNLHRHRARNPPRAALSTKVIERGAFIRSGSDVDKAVFGTDESDLTVGDNNVAM
jgi:hypothetical protein